MRRPNVWPTPVHRGWLAAGIVHLCSETLRLFAPQDAGLGCLGERGPKTGQTAGQAEAQDCIPATQLHAGSSYSQARKKEKQNLHAKLFGHGFFDRWMSLKPVGLAALAFL